MQPRQRFRQLFEAEFGEAGEEMACRDELVKAVERGVRRRGQEPALAKYLRDAFGAATLSELPDDKLEIALGFVELLEQQAPPRQLMPVVPGMEADGEACWFRGKMRWS